METYPVYTDLIELDQTLSELISELEQQFDNE